MSRIGKKPITIPKGVTVKVVGNAVEVQGPKGTMRQAFPSGIDFELVDGALHAKRASENPELAKYHGLARTLVANAVAGVTEGYKKTLVIQGVGYRVVAKGKNLEFSLGYSHPITVEPPEGITFTVERPTQLTVEGIDKQKVGEIAANIRKLRKPDPYKGKGVRYEGEQIRRKVGKAGK